MGCGAKRLLIENQHGGCVYRKNLLETGGKFKLGGSGVEHMEILVLLVRDASPCYHRPR